MSEPDWTKVDAALDFLKSIDIVELAFSIVEESAQKGPKEAYNVAGKARFQLAKLRSHHEYLQETICRDDIETIKASITQLENQINQKRAIAGQSFDMDVDSS